MGSDLRRLVSSVICCFCLIFLPLQGQQPSGDSSPDFEDLVVRAFGQDQELVNGMQYYNKHSNSLGHPYFLQGSAHLGSVTIRGRLYSQVWLKYDIHAQQVEVEYRTINGADNQVILVGDRLDEFTIEKNYFNRLKLDDEEGEQFYQVIIMDPLVLYIHWEKILVPGSGDSRYSKEFTSPKRDYFLEMEGKVYSFHNKGSYVKLFPKPIQKDLKKIIRSNYIQIRNATTDQLELLLLAAGNLISGGE